MFVFKAGVVGAGAVGGEIAQVIAAADVPVVLKDVDQAFVDAGLARARQVTERQVAKLVEREKLTAEAGRAQVEQTLGLIVGTTSYDGFGDVDLVIEAVPERIEIKHAVFAELDAVTPGHAVLASNTSRLSITEIGDATGRPDKVVGLHFFPPAAAIRLVEVVEGEDTSADTVQAAAGFAQAIRKQPIRCAECPGFVVNRILTAAASEVWRHQDETGAEPEGLDEHITQAAGMAVGPFRAAEQTGLDTVVAMTRDLRDAYGDRFWVHRGMEAGVERGDPGAKSGGGPTDAPEGVDPRLAERFDLKALVEACLVLEEGVAGMRDIDLGMMLGAGMVPGPFARADRRGLGDVLAALERAEVDWGERFEPPLILRRLVAQGRLGPASGQGFYPYPQPEAGYEEAPVKLERRGEIAILWLDNPPANSLAPAVIEALERAWGEVDGSARAAIVASPNPALFCAGADIKAFTRMDEADARDMVDRAHALFRSWERSRTMTIAAVNGLALGGGCELAMACDVRLAGHSASFGQPEIGLGIIPGFGGTQRLPRLVGPAKALEMNTTGEPMAAGEAFEYGLVNRVEADHELFDAALGWAHRFAGQAPVALERIKRVSHAGDLDEGIEAEKRAFLEAFTSEDAREGISAFLDKRAPKFKGS